MGEFIAERRQQIAYDMLQHANLVFQCVLVATLVAVLLAVLINRFRALEPIANAVSAIGLTLPAFALVGLLLPLTSLGTVTAFTCVVFYAVLPVLRNAVVGLAGVDPTLLESARGMGMSPVGVLLKVQLPLAWPVILAGVRTSMQMSMGIAAIAAYVLGPGLGSYIWRGLTQTGGANALNYALVGTIGIIAVALVADLLLLVLGRLTISKGVRVA
ncbi:ABC transporter permease [Nocardioides sp. ChNu-153]|uniref:ABC transporter permease n=1 Tax=unclassified Nocardioides TaxID=2615069 RepID=UPI0024068288|nr:MULTISPECIES: ABC transporter permease [unclassified Nocardioides]MDF9715664.1 ABC transporter permease [Nocardioides sp. ChNu-99]MDN7121648.1 ABC transporter permease [Nocardioides sp. ChNu-153]